MIQIDQRAMFKGTGRIISIQAGPLQYHVIHFPDGGIQSGAPSDNGTVDDLEQLGQEIIKTVAMLKAKDYGNSSQ